MTSKMTVDLLSSPASTLPISDLSKLESSLQTVVAMLDRVLSYVRAVLAGEKKGDAAVGRYLMDTFGTGTEELEKGGFANSLQVGALFTNYFRLLIFSSYVSGHPHDVLPREPRACSSGGLLATCSRHCLTVVDDCVRSHQKYCACMYLYRLVDLSRL